MSQSGSEPVRWVHQQEIHMGGRKKIAPQAFILGCKAFTLGLKAEERSHLGKEEGSHLGDRLSLLSS